MTGEQSDEVVVLASGVCKRFGDHTAVSELDLSISAGTIYGLLGPNGCGKTTTMRLLTGLLTPSEGEIEVLGLSVPRDAEALRYKTGYMTQYFSLYRNMTVEENLTFICNIYGLSKQQRRRRISDLMDRYELGDIAGQFAGHLSGGQRQRLALAAAVVQEPRVLFLDEPTSAVDPETRRQFWEQLFDLSDAGASIVVSTHFMDEAERCHRIAILDAGVKRADGKPRDLMESLDSTVLEVHGPDLRQIRQDLIDLPEVLSAAQIGNTLRVLVSREIENPEEWLKNQPQARCATKIEVVRANLEDVFVAKTKS